jgi:hypothetical protein
MVQSWEPFQLTDAGKFFVDAMHKEPAAAPPAAK